MRTRYSFKIMLFVASVCLLAILALPTQAQQPYTGQIIGEVRMFSGSTLLIPYGFLAANGSCYSTSTYPDLYSVIGTSYGTSGAGTFCLPDLRGKFPLGAYMANCGIYGCSFICGNQTCNYDLGDTGGETAHVLTIGELARHAHGLYGTLKIPAGTPVLTDTGHKTGGIYQGEISGYTGSDEAHNNVPEYLALNYIIAYTYALTSSVAPTYTPMPTYTPAATYTPENTQTPAATYTPEPTYTPAATYTPGPTYTPAATYTPGPTYTPSYDCSYPDFPSAQLVDDFNRADEGPPPSADWDNVPGTAGLYVQDNQLFAQDGYSAAVYTATVYSQDIDAYTTVITRQATLLYVRSSGLDDGYFVSYSSAGSLSLEDASDIGTGPWEYVGNYDNAQIGIRAVGTSIKAYFRHDGGPWTEELSIDDDTHQHGGNIYLLMASPASVDNLYAGEVPCQPVAMVTPDAYTHTLESGNTLYLPVIFSFGQTFVGLFLLALGGVLTLRFVVGMIWH